MTDGMMPGLSPEEQEFVRRAHEEMRRRQRDDDFAPDPGNPDKLIGGMPGPRVIRPARDEPLPLPPAGDRLPDG